MCFFGPKRDSGNAGLITNSQALLVVNLSYFFLTKYSHTLKTCDLRIYSFIQSGKFSAHLYFMI